MMNHRFLTLLLLLCLNSLVHAAFDAAKLPARGEVIISEVILDDDGHLAAVPGVQGPHTAVGDMVVELKNVSGRTLDLNFLHLMYVVDPNPSHNSPLSGSYDICGLSTSDSVVQTFAMRSREFQDGRVTAMEDISDGDYFLTYFNGPGTNNSDPHYLDTDDAGPDTGGGWYVQKNSGIPAVTDKDRHQLPPPVPTSYTSSSLSTTAGFHRFYMAGQGEFSTNEGHPDILDDLSVGEVTESTPYTDVIRTRGLSQGGLRVCYGNRFTNDNYLATENTDGSAGTATAVERNTVTLLLMGFNESTGEYTDILDVFSIGNPGEHSQIGTALSNPALLSAYGITGVTSPYTFDFAGSDLDMFDLATDNALLDSGSRGLHEVAYQRTIASQNRASNSRSDYFKSLSSPGGDTVLPPSEASNYLAGIEVRRMRGLNPFASSASAPGDRESTYRVQLTTNVTDPLETITANLIIQSSGAVTASQAMTLINPATGLWEAVFSGTGGGSGGTLLERNVRFDFSTQGGSPISTSIGDGLFYTRSYGPKVVAFSRAAPTGSGPHADNTVFSMQASLFDTGTPVIGSTQVTMRTTDGIPVAGTATTMNCGTGSGNITCTADVDIDNIDVFNQTPYCFELSTQDEYGNATNGENTCSNPFQILKRPRIQPGAFVRVTPGQSVTIDLSDPEYLNNYNYPAGQISFGNPAAGFPDSTVTCSLSGTDLTITAPSVFSSGSCGIEVIGSDPGLGATAWEGPLSVLPDENSTVLNSFRLAPGTNPISPATLDNFTQVSFADFFEVEAQISDGQGIASTDNTAVIMHMIVTDTAAVPSAPVTAYSVYLYNDGNDFRQSASMPPGAAFGSRYLYGYTLNDNNRVATLASAPFGATTFPAGPGGPNFYSFKIDPVASLADDTWRIALKPFDLQVSTTFQLDLEIKDNPGNVTYFPDVGRVKIAAGPGYVTKPIKDTWTEGDVSERTISLLDYECDAPFNVGTRKCGGAGNNQLTGPQHNELYWTVEGFDGSSDPPTGPRTGFFEYVNSAVLPADQNFTDQFLVKGNPESCGTGFINFALFDSEGYRVTTDEFSVQVGCVDDPPRMLGPYATSLVPEDSTSYAIDLSTLAAELSQINPSDGTLLPDGAPLFGETTRTAMTWEIAYGHASEDVSLLTTYYTSGTDLILTAAADSFHSATTFDTVVVCASDATGNRANGGSVGAFGSTTNCEPLNIQVVDSDDNPVISVPGTLPATPLASPLNVLEDTPTTFQVGVHDVDGPFPAVWSSSVVTDPDGVLQSISFSAPALVGTSGETQQMLITPSVDRSGKATVVIQSNTGALSVTQVVEIHVAPGNDPPSFVSIPCPTRPLISELEDFGTTSSVLDFGAVTDVDLADPVNPRNPADYSWSLGSVTYEGFVPVNSANEGAGMTAVAGVESLGGLNTQTSIAGMFQIQVSGNGTGGTVQLVSESLAYGDATLHIRITDQGGLFAENSQCKLHIESVTNPPVIREDILTAEKTLNEDQEGYFFDLGQYELDPFNALTTDEDLYWSVRLTQPSTFFSIPTSYPAHFQALLHAENQASGVYDRIRLGNNAEGSIATTATSVHIDPVLDRLYIRPGPDIHGSLPLTLELNRTGSTPTVTDVVFTIDPVNDPVRISPLNPSNPSVEGNLFLELEENVSIQRLDLTTWANDARDFVPVTPNNGLIWGQTPPGLASSDSNIFTIACTSSQPFENGDADAGLLCLKPNPVVAYQQADATLNLTLNGNDTGDLDQASVVVRLYGHNDYPIIDFSSDPAIAFNTSVERFEWRVAEQSSSVTTSLKPFMKDEEESLSNQVENMQWYFDEYPETLSGTTPGVLVKDLMLGSHEFQVSIDQVSKSLTYSVTRPNLSGAVLPPVTMSLCDFGHPFYETAAVNSTRTSRKCSSVDLQFFVEAVNDPPSLSIPSAVATTLLTGLEGSCISADLSPYATDPDSVGQFSMSVVSGSLKSASLDESLFEMPVVTSSGFVLSGSPLGRETNCSLPENSLATGPLSPKALRMYGSVEVSLLLTDTAGASSTQVVTLDWKPDWTPPTISPASAWSTSPLTSNLIWSVKEDSSTSSVFLETRTPYQVLTDPDFGFGEANEDYNWSLVANGVTTDEWITSAFSLKITSAVTGDSLHLTPRPNGSTPLTTVALSVTDAHGLTGTRILQIVVEEENDFPYLTGAPAICAGSNSCFSEDSVTSIDLASILKDDLDVPPDALVVRMKSDLTTACTLGPSGANTLSTTYFDAVGSGSIVTFTARPDQFHPPRANGSQPRLDTIRFCLTDARSVATHVLQTDLDVFVRPVNDPPSITNPTQGASWELLEGESRTIPLSVTDFRDSGVHDYMPYFGVPEIRRVTSADLNAATLPDPQNLFELNYLNESLQISANDVMTTSDPYFYRIRIRDQGDSWQQNLNWHLSYGPEETTTSVIVSLTSTPVNDAPQFCALGNTANCSPYAGVNLETLEDQNQNVQLNTLFRLEDEEDTAASRYAFSFNPSTVITSAVFSTSGSQLLRLNLTDHEIGPNQRDSFNTKLGAQMQMPETTGAILGASLYLLDQSETPWIASTLPINWTFQAINDPPTLLGGGLSMLIAKDSLDPESLDLTPYKSDLDTPLNRVCFAVADYDPNMIQAFIPQDYGPAVFNQTNCTPDDEELMAYALPGVIGRTNLTLQLFDTTDLSSVTTSVSIQIVATEPLFDPALPARSELSHLVLTQSGVQSYQASQLLTDDQPIVVNPAEPNFFLNESDLDVSALLPAGARKLSLSAGFVNARIDPGTGALEIEGDYTRFEDGVRNFWLYYEDQDQNLSKMLVSVEKRHGFLQSLAYDDANGSGGLDFGDRFYLGFSSTSGGIAGVQSQVSSAIQPLTTNNTASVISGTMASSPIAFGAFGVPTPYSVQMYSSDFESTSRGGAYIELTLNTGFNANLDGVAVSHIASPPFQILAFERAVEGTSRQMSLALTADTVAPRLVSARLMDQNGDGQYRLGDHIEVIFSEVLEAVSAQKAIDIFELSGGELGEQTLFEQKGNRIRLHLGADASLNPAATMTLRGRDVLQDKASNSLQEIRDSAILSPQDTVGPRVLSIELDKRSVSALPQGGDRVRILLDEALDPASLQGLSADQILRLPQTATFGNSATVSLSEDHKSIEIEIGPTAAGLNAGTRVYLSPQLRDVAGNFAYKNVVLADEGDLIPVVDTVAPEVSLQYSREGRVLDFSNPLTVINAGDLLLEFEFSEPQTQNPQISIRHEGVDVVSSQDLDLNDAVSPLNSGWFYRHQVRVEDGLNQIIVSGDSDPVSGLPLKQPKNASFAIDTRAPVLDIDFGAGSTDSNPTELSNLTLEGTASENIEDLRLQILTQSASVSGTARLNPSNSREFTVSLSNLTHGENRFSVSGFDVAGNRGELTVSVFHQGQNPEDGSTDGGSNAGPDLDWDDDGVINAEDVFPRDPSEWEDTDGDSVGDNRDPDDDGDGIADEEERAVVIDGLTYNFSKDSDNDGLPNAFDADMDGDGIPNQEELEIDPLSLYPTGRMLDFDNDGLKMFEDPDDDNDGVEDSKQLPSVAVLRQAVNQKRTAEDVLGSLNAGENAAGPSDGRVLIPASNTSTEYDLSSLGSDYAELKQVLLPRSENLSEAFPVLKTGPDLEANKFADLPSDHEVVGRVIEIKGKIKPGRSVEFPFPLPGYFARNTVVRTQDFQLQYFDRSIRQWVTSGQPLRLEGAVLYSSMAHFSEWRVIRSLNSVFDTNAGQSLSGVGSGTGGGGGGGGCFVVTAASGHRQSFLVQAYSLLRDAILIPCLPELVEFYYRHSPSLARTISSGSIALRGLLMLLLCMPLMLLIWMPVHLCRKLKK